MLNIANFLSQILPQQQQMDGYKSAFTADGLSLNIPMSFSELYSTCSHAKHTGDILYHRL